MPPEELWLKVISHVMALGAFLVREKRWQLVRELVLQRPSGEDFANRYYNNWIRHALTMAARAELVHRAEDATLISVALARVRENECLRPDLPVDDERLLNSVCQFDFLACVVALDEAGDLSTSNFYPNFSRYYSGRTNPIVERLLDDAEMRSAIFHRDDEDLAVVLRELDTRATRESFAVAGWDGYSSSVNHWIEQHMPKG
jgi:hypothetical protein